MVLDGLEPMILNLYWRSSVKKTLSIKYNIHKVHVVRFADDFIVTASDKETLEKIKQMIGGFLLERGLTLSKEKIVITHIDTGFDSLGWNFRKFKGKLIVKPSHKSMCKISSIIKDNQTVKQEDLIRKLNEVIIGLANYNHSACAKKSYSAVDHRTWGMLWKWAKRGHPNKSKGWIVNKYWKPHKGRKWAFMSDRNILFLMMDMPIVCKGQMALNKIHFLTKSTLNSVLRSIA